MKKLLLTALTLVFAASFAMAQTPEQIAASAGRILKLKSEAPKDCGVDNIDALVAKCKAVAGSTVGIDEVTSTLQGKSEGVNVADLKVKFERAQKELGEAGELLKNATASLQELKNPMKIKPATKSLNYGQEVLTTAGEELTYQGTVIAGLVN